MKWKCVLCSAALWEVDCVMGEYVNRSMFVLSTRFRRRVLDYRFRRSVSPYRLMSWCHFACSCVVCTENNVVVTYYYNISCAKFLG